MNNLLYVKFKDMKKPDLLILEYFVTQKKVGWILTEEQLKKAKEVKK